MHLQDLLDSVQNDDSLEALSRVRDALAAEPQTTQTDVDALWAVLRKRVEQVIPPGSLVDYYLSLPPGDSFLKKVLEFRVTFGLLDADKVFCVDRFVPAQECPGGANPKRGVVGRCRLKLHDGTVLSDLGTTDRKTCRRAENDLARTDFELDDFFRKGITFRRVAYEVLEYTSTLRFIMRVTRTILQLNILDASLSWLRDVGGAQSVQVMVKTLFNASRVVLDVLVSHEKVLEAFVDGDVDVEVDLHLVGKLVHALCLTVETALRTFQTTSRGKPVNVLRVLHLLVVDVLPRAVPIDHMLRVLGTDIGGLDRAFTVADAWRHDFFAYVNHAELFVERWGFTLKSTFLTAQQNPLVSGALVEKVLGVLGLKNSDVHDVSRVSLVETDAGQLDITRPSYSVLLKKLAFVVDNESLLEGNHASLFAVLYQKVPTKTLLNITLRTFAQEERYVVCKDNTIRPYHECLEAAVAPDNPNLSLVHVLEYYLHALQTIQKDVGDQAGELCNASVDFPEEIAFVQRVLKTGRLTFQDLDRVLTTGHALLYCDALAVSSQPVVQEFRLRVRSATEQLRESLQSVLQLTLDTVPGVLRTSTQTVMQLLGVRQGAVYGRPGVLHGTEAEGYV